MPIYEYRRPDGTTFELQQSFSDAALTADPDSGVPVERVLHAPAVHFKGKGFYNTDYGTRNRQREAAENAAEKKSSGESGSGESGSGKSSAGESGSGKSSAGESAGASKADGKDPKPAKAKDSKPVTATKQG